jgi:hypothetical protein
MFYYRKGNMYFGSEPIKQTKNTKRNVKRPKKPVIREFGTLVRQLKEILMSA